MMCGAAKGAMGAIHKLPCVSLTHRKTPAHCNASTAIQEKKKQLLALKIASLIFIFLMCNYLHFQFYNA